MSKVRVLIVDDAVVVRRLLSDVLAADPQVEVAGTAANGIIALCKIPQVNPDVVTLDIEMPEMDGLATLREIRKRYPRLPVIMFSTLSTRGATATFDALAAGANDYVTKPANVGNIAAGMAKIREELLPKIKSLGASVVTQTASGNPEVKATLPARPLTLPGVALRVDAVVIGISTGGPNALAEVIPALPDSLAVPVFIAQHMPAVFTRLLAERLQSKSRIRVREAVDGEAIEPGTVYVAPGDYHLTIRRQLPVNRIALTQTVPENSCRPAVDVLFRSAAAAYGANTLGAVLTGMGQDGLRGSKNILDAGGRVFVQDDATSVVWGMPGCVCQAGLSDKSVPLGEIANEITRRVELGRSRKRVSA